MPVFTSHHGRLESTGDEELDKLLLEVRSKTKQNWQIDVRKHKYKHWFRTKEATSVQLMMETPTSIPGWQLISSVRTINEAKCYLYGLLTTNDRLLGLADTLSIWTKAALASGEEWEDKKIEEARKTLQELERMFNI